MKSNYIIIVCLYCIITIFLYTTVYCFGDLNSKEANNFLPATINLANRKIKINHKKIEPRLVDTILSPGELSVLGIVLLTNKPSRRERAELIKSGVILWQYLHGTAYYAEFERKKGELEYPSFLLWADKLKPEDKLERNLWKEQYEPWAITKGGSIKVLVSFRKGIGKMDILHLLKKYTKKYLQHNEFRVWRAEIKVDNLIKLASDESVYWIEQGPHPSMPLGKNDKS